MSIKNYNIFIIIFNNNGVTYTSKKEVIIKPNIEINKTIKYLLVIFLKLNVSFFIIILNILNDIDKAYIDKNTILKILITK